MTTHQRKPYSGTERKLVIAIDVGTTFSGVSYALLDPGMMPQIQPVTQFLGQSAPRGDSKVPSIICYREDGTVAAAGAATDPETNPELAAMDDVIRVEWFKLHLRPPHLAPSQEFELQKVRAFPKNKKPVQVFGDFLGYLFQSTKQYIMDSESWSWDSVEKNTYFVLSHPNGWEGKQQSQMRKAAIAAGLVDKSKASERISFVSEGEASLHFCLNKKTTLRNIRFERDGILVVDCGGGTIDVSAYSQTIKGTYTEITPSESHFQGSIFVTCRAKIFLEQKLQNSKYGSEYEIEAMASSFDRVTKCTFNDPKLLHYIKFGGFNYNDPNFDIRSGSIKIAGSQIACFFQPAIQDIIRLIDRLRSRPTVNIKTVLLVGGFAKSNYLFSQLNSYFYNCFSITRVDITHLNKAVADGAVSYYLDHYVDARMAKYSYGKKVLLPFDATNPEHARRENTKFMYANGKHYILGGFATVLKKGTSVSEETKFRSPFQPLYTPEEFYKLTKLSKSLGCYRGEAESPPKWIDLEPNSFHDICMIEADTVGAKKSMSLKYNPYTRKPYYLFNYEIVILFGLTELKAYITWNENGIEKRSEAIIIYE